MSAPLAVEAVDKFVSFGLVLCGGWLGIVRRPGLLANRIIGCSMLLVGVFGLVEGWTWLVTR